MEAPALKKVRDLRKRLETASAEMVVLQNAYNESKEARSQWEALEVENATLREQLAALNRKVEVEEKRLKALERQATDYAAPTTSTAEADPALLQRTLATLRKRRAKHAPASRIARRLLVTLHLARDALERERAAHHLALLA